MDHQHVELKKDRHVAEITLASPPLNILTTAMMREIEQIVADLGQDRNLKLLVLKARGGVFCGGADVTECHPDLVQETMGHFDNLFLAMDRLPFPVVSEVRGAAIAAGCELALFSDVVLASEKASFALPEVKSGFFPPIASVILIRLIGRNRAMELCITGRTLKAPEAHAWGLVNHLYPEAAFDAEAAALKDQILEASPLILRFAKRVVDMSHAVAFQHAYAQVGRTFMGELMRTEDVLEGIEAVKAGRKPEWKNQ